MYFGFDEPVKRIGKFLAFKSDITGPKDYMEQRGFDLMERIESGKDLAFRDYLESSARDAGGNPDVACALMQRLQADYLAWKGMNNGREQD